MEPITAIVMAFATGAASKVGGEVVQDLYNGIKRIIHEKYQQAQPSLEALEKKPESASKRESLEEDLKDSGAGNDIILLEKSQELLKTIEEQAPQIAQAIGVKLEDVKAANLRLKEIIVSGEQAAGVHINKGEFTGDIEISNIKVDAVKK